MVAHVTSCGVAVKQYKLRKGIIDRRMLFTLSNVPFIFSTSIMRPAWYNAGSAFSCAGFAFFLSKKRYANCPSAQSTLWEANLLVEDGKKEKRKWFTR